MRGSSMASRVRSSSRRGCRRRASRSHDLLFISRFGVGYDSVDVPACTAADVVVLIAAGAVDRSVAEATVAWMLAPTHEVRVKDRLLREGCWRERSRFMDASFAIASWA